jgi:hypothetical protein
MPKSNCVFNSTHTCCSSFVLTMEVFRPAWEYASLVHQSSPVWLVLGSTVGLDGMLQADEIEELDRTDHFRMYYERDREIMRNTEPLLGPLCATHQFELALIDGNEYTGWAEFEIVDMVCKSRFIALHDTGTLKTRMIERYLAEHPERYRLIARGTDDGVYGWSVYARQID